MTTQCPSKKNSVSGSQSESLLACHRTNACFWSQREFEWERMETAQVTRLMDWGIITILEDKRHITQTRWPSGMWRTRVTTKLLESPMRKQMHQCHAFNFYSHRVTCQLWWTRPMERGHLSAPRRMCYGSWLKWRCSDWSSVCLIIFILWVKTKIFEFPDIVGRNGKILLGIMTVRKTSLPTYFVLDGMGRRLKGDR